MLTMTGPKNFFVFPRWKSDGMSDVSAIMSQPVKTANHPYLKHSFELLHVRSSRSQYPFL